MRRVTRKARPVKSAGQLEHYVFGSDRHRTDKAMADRLRATEYIPTTVAVPTKGPFPRAKELAENLVLGEDGKWEQVPPGVYVKRLLPFTSRKAGTYWATKKVRGEVLKKKDGTPVMQRQHTRALHDIYLSLPPWISEVLAHATQTADGMATVRRVAEQAALAAADVLEKRTGYKAVGVALHPDARNAFGIHIQYLTVENGQLLGRSQGGGRGRRGVRLAGDVNCALHRFGQVREIPGGWNKVVAERDYDDIAMIDAMDETIEQVLPGADFYKEPYVDAWLARRKKTRGDLAIEVDELREELKKTRAQLEEKDDRIRSLEDILSISTLNVKTDHGREVVKSGIESANKGGQSPPKPMDTQSPGM